MGRRTAGCWSTTLIATGCLAGEQRTSGSTEVGGGRHLDEAVGQPLVLVDHRDVLVVAVATVERHTCRENERRP